MKKAFTFLFSILLFLSIISCTSMPFLLAPPSATKPGPRTIIIDDKSISEEEVEGFISWYCQDYTNEGPVLVEVGYYGDPNLEGSGFILYDGGYTGESTYYRREGLERRWDWGPNGSDYTFVIVPDGTGLYYDFTTVKPGESTKAREVYKCHQR